ncbi:MAG TPA: outer membrane beta-barrel protein, partial [Stellaceae bacterium]|nr:outer membrane beta-barrel protein [Stellaceae bacterium]
MAASGAAASACQRFARFKSAVAAIGIATAGLIGTLPAQAQLVPGIPPITIGPPQVNSETLGIPLPVLDRPPLELSAIGIQTVPGLILPTVTGTGVYDDNIFASQFTRATDLLFHLRPEVTLRSPLGMLTYTAQFYADLVKFTEHPQLSNGNLGFSLGMRKEFARDWLIESQTAAKYDHQDPSGFALPVPNATVGSLPIYTILQENITLRYRTGRFRLSMTGGYEREDFANTIVGGTPIKESTLNANAWQLEQRTDYYLSHLTQLFIDNTLLRREYDNRILNSTGLTTLVGTVIEFHRLIRGTGSIGWRERVYDLRNIGSVGSPTFAFNLAWFPTEMLTVLALGSEEFADSPITTANGSSAIIDIRTMQV